MANAGYAPRVVAISVPPAEANTASSRQKKRDLSVDRLTETFRDHFFRPQNLVAPEESALHPHHDLAILLHVVRRLKAHHAVQSPVYLFFRLDLAYFHPVQDLG